MALDFTGHVISLSCSNSHFCTIFKVNHEKFQFVVWNCYLLYDHKIFSFCVASWNTAKASWSGSGSVLQQYCIRSFSPSFRIHMNRTDIEAPVALTPGSFESIQHSVTITLHIWKKQNRIFRIYGILCINLDAKQILQITFSVGVLIWKIRKKLADGLSKEHWFFKFLNKRLKRPFF